MTLTTAIVVIVLADVVLIAGLIYVMSRASRLRPHASASVQPAAATPEPAPEQRRRSVAPGANRIGRSTRIPTASRS